MALIHRLRIAQVPSSPLQILAHVLATARPTRRIERHKLAIGAMRRRHPDGRAHEAAHGVRERIDPVHEDPEAGQRVRAREDAAEGVQEDAEERDEARGEVLAGRACDDHVPECGREEEGAEHDEEGVECADVDGVCGFGVAVKACGVVPDDEAEYGDELQMRVSG